MVVVVGLVVVVVVGLVVVVVVVVVVVGKDFTHKDSNCEVREMKSFCPRRDSNPGPLRGSVAR